MGPLDGIKVVELAGIGPGPFAAMVLADLGADVLRIERVTPSAPPLPDDAAHDPLRRGRPAIAVDLQHPAGVSLALRLVERAHVLIEGYRPGVTERLGIGPEPCLARNPRLVYGRMTGWGQSGPLSGAAGHDINYIALTGVLDAIGRAGQAPTPPLNLVADFGGGGMMLALGVVSALYETTASGEGQIVDAAMVDGAALLSTMVHGLRAMHAWNDERGTNLLDSGAPFYDVYQAADGKYVAVGALEPKFFTELLRLLGLDESELPDQGDQTGWPSLRRKLASLFRTRTRDEWCELMEGTDACFAPVLSIEEATEHPHNRARQVFLDINGVTQPAPAPRFSRTQTSIPKPPGSVGSQTEAALSRWDVTAQEVSAMRDQGVLV